MKDNPVYRIAQRRIEQLGREAAEAGAEYDEASRALKARRHTVLTLKHACGRWALQPL